jgi:hypothetical protein
MSDTPINIKPVVMPPPNPEIVRLFDFLWWTAAGCPKEETAPKR